MSLFGESLPYEDETAASLIRKSGFPPEKSYVQMPQSYICPCCSEFNEAQERERLVRAARDEKEEERRRIMQLDVFDERAKPLPSAQHKRKLYQRMEEPEQPYEQESVPPPPATLEELRRSKKEETSPAKLIVTVHYGKNLDAQPADPMSVIVRCGAFEGQTAKVSRGKGTLTTWDELFEFPYANPEENLEVLVINDSLPESNDHLLGGVVVPNEALHDKSRGDEESLPVCPDEEMRNAFDKMKEGPNGAIVVSWYVSEDGEEPMEDGGETLLNLENPLDCTFVVHRVFQYADNGSQPFPQGVLCVLRDTEDNCSESVLYVPGSNMETSLSPYYDKEGYHYLPENASQVMQLGTEKKLGHILVCVPKQENTPESEEEELLVVGAVPVDFSKLYHKGNAVLFIESKSKDDALWGEISLEWLNKSQNDEKRPAVLDVDKECLIVNVVRGLNLVNREKVPVTEAYASVAAGEMEGFTLMAPNNSDGGDNHVVTWNQEVRFMDVDPQERELEAVVFENGVPISTGKVEINPEEDEAVVVIRMHDMFNDSEDRGEIIVNYKRLHASDKSGAQPCEENAGEGNEHPEDQDEEAAAESENDANDLSNEEAREEENNSESAENRNGSDGNEAVQDEEKESLEQAQDENDKEGHDDEENEDENARDDADEENDDAQEEEKNDSNNSEAADDEQKDDAEEQKEEKDEADNEESDERAEEDEAQEENSDKEGKDEDDEQNEKEKSDAEKENVQDDDENENRAEEADENEEKEQEEQEEENDENDEDKDQKEENGSDKNDEEKNEDENESKDENEAKENNERENTSNNDDDENDKSQKEQEQDEMNNSQDEHENESEKDSAKNDESEVNNDNDDQKNDDENASQSDQKDTADEQNEDNDANDSNANNDGANDQTEDQNEEQHDDDDANDEPQDPRQDVDDEASEGKPASDYDPETNNKGTSPSPAPRQQRRASKDPKWTDNRKSRGYQQPWYPAGRPENENHLPYEKTQRSRSNKKNIQDLEQRRSVLEEESMRRASTPRSSMSTPH